MSELKTDILVIGGGLAGLNLASKLHGLGCDVILVEARDRFGGRIKTSQVGDYRFDLGPAWFWPGQPRIAALIEQLGLHRFDQFAQGDLMFEDEAGRVQRGRGYASMEGSWRLAGGLSSLTDALAAKVPSERTLLGREVCALRYSEGIITAETSDGMSILANSVVLAVPPRVVADGITFAPALPADALQAMRNVPTWMAGQAKAVAVYQRAFWRENGLSGDAMSRFGPMVEIHDASPVEGDRFALFGFIGVPPSARGDEKFLKEQILTQLVRLFGPEAETPEALFVKDWARDPLTATQQDQRPMQAHPHYGLPHSLDGLWSDQLVFGGTESARQFGGYLEGALEASEIALHKVHTEK